MARLARNAQNPVRRHRPDYMIVLYMGLLMLLGLIMMYAIGPQRAQVLNTAYGTEFYSATYFFTKQVISLGLALAAFALVAKLPYVWFQKHAKAFFIGGIGASLVLAIAGWANLAVAKCSLGACRWFDLGPLGSVQPAEFLKFGLLIYIAGFITKRANMGLINDLYKTIIPLLAIVAVAALFVIGIQRDMGTGLAMFGIIASMLIVAGLNIRMMALLGGAGILAIVMLIAVAPHRMERVTTFFAGDNAAITADTYHIAHAKIAIGTGGLTGVGIGNSVQATGYLPEAINDSVFAIMGETFGFIGLVVVLLLFSALLMRLLMVTDRLPRLSEKLLVAGVFGWMAAHIVLNVAAMTGVMPLTGITLPLLSFGGTSMVFVAGALGLAFQLSSYTTYDVVANKERERDENSRRRRGVGRPRYSSRSGRF